MGKHYFGGLGIQNVIFISIILVAGTYTCLGAGNVTTVSCSKREQQALLKFKLSLQDDYYMLSSWVGDECCQWERVHCDGATGYVESLNLRGSRFWDEYSLVAGNEVSTSLGELRHLKHLDLSMNDFRGIRIPDFIGSLKQLSYLNLSYSYFSGIIPNHIGNLSNLKVLGLSSDQNLMVDDMAWFSGLSSLEYLELSYVNLSEAKNRNMVLHLIPSLVKLSLSGCGLSNTDLIPLLNSSTKLGNIRHLDLSWNSFYGHVPHIFENMTSLEFLDLSSFDFSLPWNFANLLSMIPSLLELHLIGCSLSDMHLSSTHLNISRLSNIEYLDLSANLIQCRFPSVLANMTSLKVIDLSQNGLNSSVPVMRNLLELDLSMNDFRDIEQVGIWRQCHLRKLSVRYNHFLMELTHAPLNISECSKYALEWLNLYGSVNGTIPESLGRIDSLIGLDLSESNLTGPIPISLGNLRFLQELDLSNNHLNGLIPESFGRLRLLEVLDLCKNQLKGPIPTFLGKLMRVDLSYNYLNGSIPESLGRLRSLEVLGLYRNQLKGPVPTFLGKLTKLYLSYNYLNGSIPESIGRLVSLQEFLVSSNWLSGTIPDSISKLTKLRILNISNNYLEGVVSEAHFANHGMLEYLHLGHNRKLTINVSHEWMPPFQLLEVDLSSCKIENGFPQWLRNQRKLEMLVLSNATISGPLPTWLGKLSTISYLDLSYNKLGEPLQNYLFSEFIPRSLCTLTNLWVLDLSNNRFTGKIPNCLGNLKSLYIMRFSSNGLYGEIPHSLGSIQYLDILGLNENNFIGELPQALGNFKHLGFLDLGDNRFSGDIPEWIGEKLTSLMVLRLHKNNFTGKIPPSLCQMSKLHILDVAHNSISGPIPHCLRELKSMGKNTSSFEYITPPFGFYSNGWVETMTQVMKGQLLQYAKTLEFVINMDLSSNKLVGEIPVEITALCGLVGLNLSNNHLSGNIPINIGNMKALTSLDFSGNELTGTIPPTVTTLNFLSHLNLSHNDLSGRIPTGNQLQTLTDPSIYAGNKDLCGAPLPKNCSNQEDPTTPPKKNYKTAHGLNKAWLYGLDIMSGFATGFWGVIGVLVLKKQWRRKLFIFAELISDKIYVAVMIKVVKMRRETEVA